MCIRTKSKPCSNYIYFLQQSINGSNNYKLCNLKVSTVANNQQNSLHMPFYLYITLALSWFSTIWVFFSAPIWTTPFWAWYHWTESFSSTEQPPDTCANTWHQLHAFNLLNHFCGTEKEETTDGHDTPAQWAVTSESKNMVPCKNGCKS